MDAVKNRLFKAVCVANKSEFASVNVSDIRKFDQLKHEMVNLAPLLTVRECASYKVKSNAIFNAYVYGVLVNNPDAEVIVTINNFGQHLTIEVDGTVVKSVEVDTKSCALYSRN